MSLRVLRTGCGIEVQDAGRTGWKQFGVPPGGPMDRHAAAWANRLAGNPVGTPLLEICLSGAAFLVEKRCWLGVAGAGRIEREPGWFGGWFDEGEEVRIADSGAGIWTYLAMAGGVRAPRFLGSASTNARAGIGWVLEKDQSLEADSPRVPPPAVAARRPGSGVIRDYRNIPVLRAWRGPQFDDFSPSAIHALNHHPWQTSPRSDRCGFRLAGCRLDPAAPLHHSEPVLVGSIQIPPSGEPVVLMRDGPTIGGYPKIALLDDGATDWLAQCRPGVAFSIQCP